MRTKQLTDLLESCSINEIMQRYDSLPVELQEELFDEAMCSNELRNCYEGMRDIGDEKFARRVAVNSYLERQGPALAFPTLNLPGMTPDKLPIPNIISNSSLFGVRDASKTRQQKAKKNLSEYDTDSHHSSNDIDEPRCEREQLYKEEVYCRAGCSIQYSGQRLYQSDQDVLLALKNLSKDGLGKVHAINILAILNQLNLVNSGENYKLVWNSIERLRVGVVAFEMFDEEKGYCIGKPALKGKPRVISKDFLNLVRECHLAYDSNKVLFQLDPRLIYLFGNCEYGLVSMTQRNALGKNDLAKLLQGLFSSQKANMQYHRIPKIQALSGLKSNSIRFKKTLAIALKKMQEVGIISCFWIPRSFDASLCIWKEGRGDVADLEGKKGTFYPPLKDKEEDSDSVKNQRAAVDAEILYERPRAVVSSKTEADKEPDIEQLYGT